MASVHCLESVISSNVRLTARLLKPFSSINFVREVNNTLKAGVRRQSLRIRYCGFLALASFPAPNHLDAIGDTRPKPSASDALLNPADALHAAPSQRDFGWGVGPFQAPYRGAVGTGIPAGKRWGTAQRWPGAWSKWEERKPSDLLSPCRRLP